MSRSKVIALIDEVSAYLDKVGWAQRIMHSRDGRCCINGAINKVMSEKVPSQDWRIMHNAIEEISWTIRSGCDRCEASTQQFGSGYIVLHNDWHMTHKREALAVLQATTERLRAELLGDHASLTNQG